MDIIKYKGEKVHVGCGGVVTRGVCLKCGEKKKGFLRRLLGDEPLVTQQKDIKALERKEHRKRIRMGKDIFKE